MRYLKIENPGVADPEAFTLLGASTRNERHPQIIGKFGSGSKHAIVVALRHECPPVIFAGTLKMEFSVRTQETTKKDFNRVVVKYGGKDRTGAQKSSTDDLGFVLEYGAADWDNVDMALREFISNAIDCSIEEDENAFVAKYAVEHRNDSDFSDSLEAATVEYRKTARGWNKVIIEIVEENQVRAKADCTRVFVPVNDAVEDFYKNLNKWFLHFSEPHLLNETILPKGDRNINYTHQKTAVIYRRGVRVREISYQASLFDYNLENLKLDESRKLDDYNVQQVAGEALAVTERCHLVQFLQSFQTNDEFWEHRFDNWSLRCQRQLTGEALDAQKAVWQEAFSDTYGPNAVLCKESENALVQHRGLQPVVIPECIRLAASENGVQTASMVLSEDERAGRVIMECTPIAQSAVDQVWGLIESFSLTNNKEKPEVKTFRKLMTSGVKTNGSYRDGVVYLNRDIADGDGECSHTLLSVALEECVHHVTEAADGSRDLQEFLFNLVVHQMLRVTV